MNKAVDPYVLSFESESVRNKQKRHHWMICSAKSPDKLVSWGHAPTHELAESQAGSELKDLLSGMTQGGHVSQAALCLSPIAKLAKLMAVSASIKLYRRGESRSLTTLHHPDIRPEHHPPTPHACEPPCSSVFPASSTPVTASASNAFPSSSNSPTLSESAPATLDNPCKSPDCWPERASGPSGENATVSTLWLFSRTCFLGTLTVFAPIVFLPTAFVFTATFFGAGFFVNFFLGIPLFLLASFILGVTFLPAVLVAFEGFFLVFFLADIRAVYHRHLRRASIGVLGVASRKLSQFPSKRVRASAGNGFGASGGKAAINPPSKPGNSRAVFWTLGRGNAR